MRFPFKEKSTSLFYLVKVDERMNHAEIANHTPHWKSTFLAFASVIKVARN
jgi:hypothetical protein